MAFTPLHLQNLTELKLRVGNATDTVIATILGLDYPNTEGFSVYVWNNTSTQTGDDNEVVVPTPRIGQGGRWLKVDLLAVQFETDPTVANYIKAITTSDIAAWNAKLSIESDPTVPSVVKGITSSDITNWNNKLSTVPAQSFSSLTGKPTTVAGYGITDALTSISSSQVIAALGYNPVNPNGTASQYIAGNGTKITFPTIPNTQIQSDWAQSNNASLDYIKNKPTIPATTTDITEGTNLYFTNSRVRTAISLTTTGTSGAASYNSTTGVLNVPNYAVSAPTFNPAPARSLNTNYTISTTKNARVSYTVALTTTLSLLNLNSAARVYLEYSLDAGTTWISINSAGTSRALSVAITIGLNETTYWNLVGEIPANALVRLRSVLSGSGTSTFDSGIEVTY